MATVKGVWVFNDLLTFPVTVTQNNISVTSNGEQIIGIQVTSNSMNYYRTADSVTAYGRDTWSKEAYKTVDFGETEQEVSDDFYTWLTANATSQNVEEPEDILYSVHGSSLTAIGDGFRSSRGTTNEYTLSEMAVLAAEPVGAELPNAEETTFGIGIDDGPTEYAITNLPALTKGNNARYYNGLKFTVLSAFSVKGFRVVNRAGSNYTSFTPKLYRLSDNELIASASVTCAGGATADVLIDTPVNLTVGETYAVFIYNSPISYVPISNITINSKIGSVVGIATTSGSLSDILASDNNSNIYGVVFPIMGESLDAEIPTEYKVQLTTMTDIAEEVQRITGTTNKMSTAQIIAALQGLNITLQDKTVTPAETAQTVTPDSGYYGLSSVTVEAIPATESEATE